MNNDQIQKLELVISRDLAYWQDQLEISTEEYGEDDEYVGLCKSSIIEINKTKAWLSKVKSTNQGGQ